jgi:hypothetical protein
MNLITNELDLLESLVPLQGARLIEAGCGAAQLAQDLLRRHTDATLVGLEVSAISRFDGSLIALRDGG